MPMRTSAVFFYNFFLVGISMAMAAAGEQEMVRTQTRMMLIFNACGTMVGTGIYTMTGQMAGNTGYATVFSYAIGLIPTLFAARVYATLSMRFPKANSLSHWLKEAWGNSFLSFLGGSSSLSMYLFAGAGTTLGATLTLFKWLGISAEGHPSAMMITCVLLLLACLALNLYGLEETSRVLAVCTILEVAGLFVIIFAVLLMPSARCAFWTLDWTSLPQGNTLSDIADSTSWLSSVVAGGAFVVFSFGGFDTIGSQAEEAIDPQRDLPAAYGWSIIIVALLNIFIMIASLCVIPPQQLWSSPDPLTDVMEVAVPWLPREVFTVVLFASAFNSVLGIQIYISRTLWGMARDGDLPLPLMWTKSFALAGDGAVAKPQPYVALMVSVAAQAALLLFGLQDLGKNCAILLVVSFMLAHFAYIGVLLKEAITLNMCIPILGLGTAAFVLYHALCTWGWQFLAGWALLSAGMWLTNHVSRCAWVAKIA